jgi:hypothetical protein
METSCGTVCCFAGWALQLDGLSFEEIYRLENANELVPVVDDGVQYNLQLPACMPEAARRLGITYDESSVLFSASNSRDMLNQMVKDLVNGEPLRDWQDYCEEGQSNA